MPVMRFAWLYLALAACSASQPPPSGPALLDAAPSDAPPIPVTCTRACTPDDDSCSTFPYEQLPPRCQDICYLGSCCNLVDGAWLPETFDCVRQMADAGTDASPVARRSE